MFGDHQGVVIAIDPDEAACAIALAQAQRVNEPYFASTVDNHSVRQIDRLQEEVQRISKMLSQMAMGGDQAGLFAPNFSREPASPFIEDHVRAPSRGIWRASPACNGCAARCATDYPPEKTS